MGETVGFIGGDGNLHGDFTAIGAKGANDFLAQVIDVVKGEFTSDGFSSDDALGTKFFLALLDRCLFGGNQHTVHCDYAGCQVLAEMQVFVSRFGGCAGIPGCVSEFSLRHALLDAPDEGFGFQLICIDVFWQHAPQRINADVVAGIPHVFLQYRREGVQRKAWLQTGNVRLDD